MIRNKITIGILICTLVVSFITGIASLLISSHLFYKESVDKLTYLTESKANAFGTNLFLAQKSVNDFTVFLESTFSLKKMKEVESRTNIKNLDQFSIPYLSNYQKYTEPILEKFAKSTKGVMGQYYALNPYLIKHKNFLGVWLSSPYSTGVFERRRFGLMKEYMPLNVPIRYWLYVPLSTGKPNWTDPYVDQDIKILMISYTRPFYVDNQLVGITGIDMSINDIKNEITKFKIYDTGYASVLSHRNTVVFSKKYPIGLNLGKINNNSYKFLITEMNKKKSGYIEYVDNSKEMISSFARLPNNFILVITVPKSEVLERINFQQHMFILIMVLGVIFSTIIAIFIGNSIAKPVEYLTHMISQFKPGQEPEKIILKTDDEIEVLSAKVNDINNLNWEYTQELLKNQLQLQDAKDRQTLLRKTGELIKSSIDLQQVFNILCKELLNLFNVENVIIAKYSKIRPDSLLEIQQSVKEKNGVIFNEMNFSPEFISFLGKKILEKDKLILCVDTNDSSYPEFFVQTCKSMGISCILGLPIKNDEEWGVLLLFSSTYREWLEEEIDLLTAITGQAFIAITHAELYQMAREQAEKEFILREVLGELKISQSLDQAYEHLLKIVRHIYNVNRIVFLEFNPQDNRKLNVKYEYTEQKSIKDVIFPAICTDGFYKLIEELSPLIIDNVCDCSEENVKAFSEEYKITSMLAVPLVKSKIFGFLVLCDEKPRTWTTKEISLLQSISESVVGVIWEMSKLVELDELRNSFIATLAHDLQVPLLGESKVLEFLMKKSHIQHLEIIENLYKNNRLIIEQLKRLLEIYNYEVGKTILNKEKNNISNSINKVIEGLFSEISFKNISIVYNPDEFLEFNFSAIEIEKVLNVLLNNAISNLQVGGQITIESKKINGNVFVSITDNGPGIKKSIQEKLFKRYQMSQEIERKIGGGFGLYLSKLIVEAHGGNIWYDSTYKNGAKFSFCIPFHSEK